MQGASSPYFNLGAQYLQQSAQPISADQVANYYNPMAANVTAQLKNIFGQQNQQNTAQLTQAAGGVGADRIAVGQGNLANQQGLAAGQTYAGLYNQALQAAQTENQMKAGAGYGLANMGPAAVQSQLAEIGALGQAGGLQQQLAQAQLNAPYQQQLSQAAFPYQVPQYLAGITGSLAGALGGTTQGQVTQPAPSLLSQILGTGVAGAGIVGQTGGFGPSGYLSNIGSGIGAGMKGAGTGASAALAGSNAAATGADLLPLMFAFKRGGVPHLADGGSYGKLANTARYQELSNIIPHAEAGNPLAQEVYSDIGRTLPMYDDGGSVVGDITPPSPFNKKTYIPAVQLQPTGGHSGMPYGQAIFYGPPSGGSDPNAQAINQGLALARAASMMSGQSAGGSVNPYNVGEGFADGGDAFDDRYAAADAIPQMITPIQGESPYSALVGGLEATQKPPMQNLGLGHPVDTGNVSLPDTVALPPNTNPVMAPGNQAVPPPLPPSTNPYAADVSQYMMPQAQSPYPDATQRDWGQTATRSPWMALITAGARMAQTRGPIGSVIGAGLEAGAGELEKQRAALRTEEQVNQKAQQLYQQAIENVRKYKDVPASEMLPYQQMTAAQKATLAAEAPLRAAQIKNYEQEAAYREHMAARPFPMGTDPYTLLPRYAVEDKNAPGGYRFISVEEAHSAGVPSAPSPATEHTQQAPLASTIIAPTGGRVVATDPSLMVSTGVAQPQTDMDAIRAYSTPQTRAKALSESNNEARDMYKQVQAADVNRQRSIEMRNSLDTISNFIQSHPNDKGLVALINPGTTGEVRQRILNAWASIPGNHAPQDVVAAINKMGKDSILAGFSNITATGLSAREAQPIIKAGMSAVASYNLPEASSRVLLASMDAASERIRDEKNFFDSYRKKNMGVSLGWREAFNEQNPPEKYVAKAIYSNLPEQVRETLPRAVTELRGARDAVIAAEHSGDQAAINAARERYTLGKRGFNSRYGGLANYFAFGTF